MIVRGARSQNYTITANAILEDSALDWRDVGLLIYLLSKPDHWKVSTAHLAAVKKTGIDGVLASLKALREAGYVQLHKLASGRSDWHVFDAPQSENEVAEDFISEDEKPKPEIPLMANEKPKREIPLQGKSSSLVSTDKQLVSTEYRNNAREPTLISDDFAIDEIVKFRLQTSGVHMLVAEFLLVEFVNQNISTGWTSFDWAAHLVSYCKKNEWRYKKHEQATRREQELPKQPESRATKQHNRTKRLYAEAIARERGAEVVQSVSGEIHASLDVVVR